MGLLSNLKRAIGGSSGPELQIHRVRLVFPDVPDGLLVYATGEVFAEPAVFRCDEPVEIPEGTVLIQQNDEDQSIEVDGRSYPVRTYTMHAPENAPEDAETVEIPPAITSRPIPEQNPQDDDIQALRDALP